jgi:2-aminoethylphosphonate dioxygenase
MSSFVINGDVAESGYCHLRRGLSEDQVQRVSVEIERLSKRAEKMLAEKRDPSTLASSSDIIVVPERDHHDKVCRYEYIAGASQEMRVLIAELKVITEEVTKTRLSLFKDKLNEKPPGGGAFPPHQDFAAYRHFGPRYNLTAMIPIDKMTSENGCVQFATNYQEVASHFPDAIEQNFEGRPLFKSHGPGPNNGNMKDEVVDKLIWTPMEMLLGDICIFDSFVPHYSVKNNTQSKRRALFLTFNREDEGEWYQHYYQKKRMDSSNPIFHVATPTFSRLK